MADTTAELRYHIELVDAEGYELCLNNLDRDAISEFNAVHFTDDLEYRVVRDAMRKYNVTRRQIA